MTGDLTDVTISEVGQAFRECFPYITDRELDNIMMVIWARIFSKRLNVRIR